MKLGFPKISIVTPSYNQGEYLEQTIQSVLNQKYPNLEYIIIDGGSTDNSVEIIKKYESKLTYWTSEKDNGLYHAIQKGFKKSTGEIMAWINSDDLYHNKCLFSVARIFTQFKNVNWIMGKNTFFDEESNCFVYDIDPYNERWSIWRFYRLEPTRFIQQESNFWRRSLWDKAGAYISQNLELAGDFELWLRFFQHEKLYTTNILIAGFRQRSRNQKSKEGMQQYIQEIRNLVKQDIKNKKRTFYFYSLNLLLRIIKIIPFKNMKSRLKGKLLVLPARILYTPNEGFQIQQK